MSTTVNKFSIDEVRGFDVARLNELSKEMRRELFDMRMDIFQPASKYSARIKTLKKNIARVLTVKQEKLLSSTKKKSV